MGKTSIEWCDRTINPFRARHKATGKVGHYCERVSPGCGHCYASSLQRRFGTPEFGGGQLRDQFDLFLDESKLMEVLRHRKPERWFWNDMTDSLGDWVPDEWLDKCFAVMAVTDEQTHQILTKRSDRMCAYMGDPHTPQRVACHLAQLRPLLEKIRDRWPLASAMWSELARGRRWPLPNVWCGVSVENQQQADKRIPDLLATPAAVRFLSVEPLLAPVDISEHFLAPIATGHRFCDSKAWVIIGGESGPHARPCYLGWIRSLARQCAAAEVACFVKQGGKSNACRHNRKGGHFDCFPDDLKVRQFPD